MSSKGSQLNADMKHLFEDPNYYVFDTLPKQNLTRFLITSEGELSDAAFADIRFDNPSRDDVFVKTHLLLKHAKRQAAHKADVFFIFHHAFVCSTLLARCLNQIDAFYALKEPWILRRIADIKRTVSTSADKRDWNQRSKMYLRLLTKNFQSGESLIIKSTNVANNLIGDVCRWQPRTKALFLYSDLESFLVSNIKKTSETKAKIPYLLNAFLMDSNVVGEVNTLTNFKNLTFLQTCASIWIANVYALKQQHEHINTGRVGAINMDLLLRSPTAALTLVSRFFGHAPTSREMLQMTSPEVMGTHAKASVRRAYSPEMRAREYTSILRSNRREIQSALSWADPLVQRLSLLPFLHEVGLA